MKRVLIIDAFTRDLRNWVHDSIGGHGFGAMIAAMIHKHWGHQVRAEPFIGLDALPDARAIRGYDGIIWTGSAVSSIQDGPHREHLRQWMHLCIEERQHMFGLCFGFQLAAVVAGGVVEPNPAGVETILARKIRLTAEGEHHAMMRLRTTCFDAVADHDDHIVELPEHSICLASNDNTKVQAGIIRVNDIEIWGVQYHPDMDIRVVRVLLDFRKEQLLEEGFFADEAAWQSYCDHVDRLIANPRAKDIAWQLGFDKDILDERTRIAELECWLEDQVINADVDWVQENRASTGRGKQ